MNIVLPVQKARIEVNSQGARSQQYCQRKSNPLDAFCANGGGRVSMVYRRLIAVRSLAGIAFVAGLVAFRHGYLPSLHTGSGPRRGTAGDWKDRESLADIETAAF